MAADRAMRSVAYIAGGAAISAAGNSTLPWSIIGRISAGKEVVLVFYHGWHYIAFPTAAVPANTIDLYTRAKTLLLTTSFSALAAQNYFHAVDLLDQALTRT